MNADTIIICCSETPKQPNKKAEIKKYYSWKGKPQNHQSANNVNIYLKNPRHYTLKIYLFHNKKDNQTEKL